MFLYQHTYNALHICDFYTNLPITRQTYLTPKILHICPICCGFAQKSVYGIFVEGSRTVYPVYVLQLISTYQLVMTFYIHIYQLLALKIDVPYFRIKSYTIFSLKVSQNVIIFRMYTKVSVPFPAFDPYMCRMRKSR